MDHKVMQIGLIGLGVVGGTLKTWMDRNTEHEIRCFDPGKELFQDLDGSAAIFISVPVPSTNHGQDIKTLTQCVEKAKRYTNTVFIRSTVLPGTNDYFGTCSMPEFLTERRANKDMDALPVLSGKCNKDFLREVFPGKNLVIVTNVEAELAKLAHNCHGAFKVTFWNMIYQISNKVGADYQEVLRASALTGYIGKEHTQVPGPDSKFGYGGKCFPQNMRAMETWLAGIGLIGEANLFEEISEMNKEYRNAE